MTEWVMVRNIERFNRLLAEEKDPYKRRITEMLLEQEQEKLTAGTVKAPCGA